MDRYIHTSSLMNFLCFHISTDYILSISYFYDLGANTSVRLYLLTSRVIVVEGRTIRSFPADFQFLFCTQDLTLCYLTNFFCFRNIHTQVYFILMLQFSQLYGDKLSTLPCSSIFVCFVGCGLFHITTYRFPYMLTIFINAHLLMAKVTSMRSQFNQSPFEI